MTGEERRERMRAVTLEDLGVRVTHPSVGEAYPRLWESQVVQYPELGEPSIADVDYFLGEIDHEDKVWQVHNLLFRGQDGRVIGILQFYPEGGPDELEKPGNFNIWVHAEHQREGIGTMLFSQAERRWGPLNLGQQDYTPEGYALVGALVDETKRIALGAGTKRVPFERGMSERIRQAQEGRQSFHTNSASGEIEIVTSIPEGKDFEIAVVHDDSWIGGQPKLRIKTMRRSRPAYPDQMVDVRDELLEGWEFWPTAATAIGDTADVGTTERANNMLTILAASLWWVGDEMCDLIYSTMHEIPEDVKITDLLLPSDAGLIFLEAPMSGIDSGTGERTMRIDAFTWARTKVGPAHIDSVSITAYRFIDLGVMSKGDIELASACGLMAALHGGMDRRLVKVGGEMHYVVVGGHWCPLGRSDWPIVDELTTVGVLADSPKSHFGAHVEPEGRPGWVSSSVEDRRFLAAFCTLLQSELLAKVEERRPSRQAVKHAQHRKERVPSPVKIVTLRRARSPKREGEPGEGHLSHRFPVRAHPRWQACGPHHSQRKLIMVRAHVRGPETAPFVPKEVVHRWVR